MPERKNGKKRCYGTGWIGFYTIGARMRRRTDGYEAAESFRGKYRKLRHAKDITFSKWGNSIAVRI